MRKKIYALLLSAAMVLSVTGCSEGSSEDTATISVSKETLDKKETVSSDKETTKADPEETTTDNEFTDPEAQSSYSIVVDRDGSTKITRSPKGKGIEADPGTWTFLVYMCGADLESKHKCATNDLQEMIEATRNENIKFVVFTGGANSWQNDIIDSSKNQIVVISDGKYEVVYEIESRNMGDETTLENFITYGIANYPAEKMGIDFWNHGSGSINGVCFDELNDDDSLSLREIDAALFNVRNTFDVNFEFIGFDACLMGTLETANVMATYANYMFGSEETEPGSGWDYTAIGSFLAENPTADGAALGKVVADSFYESCKREEQHDNVTFTIFDLSKIDDFIKAYNQFFYNVYTKVSEDSIALSKVIRGIYAADNFGGNNKTEGYTNMVDLGGIVHNLSQEVEGGDAVFAALEKVVNYNINGSNHAGALGVSTYYPLKLKGSMELSIFANICTSPHYLSLVDMIQRSQHDGTSFDDYSNDDMFGEDGWQQSNDYDYDAKDDDYSYDDEDDYFSYLDEENGYEVENTITFEVEPTLTDNGTFYFVLDDNGYNNAMMVQANVYQQMDDDKIIEIGQTLDVHSDWETGEFSDFFDGYWISLPDGQNLALYIADTTEEYVVYTSPIILNGVEINLRIIQYSEDSSIEIQGAWEGIGANGSVGRQYHTLQDGDVIVPIYYVYKDESDIFKGREYIYNSEEELCYSLMDAGNYYYGFAITDIYGYITTTTYVEYDVDEEGGIIFRGGSSTDNGDRYNENDYDNGDDDYDYNDDDYYDDDYEYDDDEYDWED